MKARLTVVLATAAVLTAALAAPAAASVGLLDGGLGDLVGRLLSSVIPAGILG
ncbi:hypothetical protein [Nonomuraea terrae]|uniref:hypothetical protein n=1 Tax=Nonomuraea terrae TaxID=2530383 RepID=UPI0014043654|nr:hypothetical protein [Nonomuraea terrae]